MIEISRRPDGLTSSDLGWLRQRSRIFVTNVVRNLRSAASRKTPALRHADGRIQSAIIIGAGPSLEKNRHLLRAAQDNGWTLICVNASAPAIFEHVEPDYCVVRELAAVHLGLPEMPSRTKLLVDIGAHEAVFDRAYAWFVAAAPRHYEMCARLGVRPVYAGTAALTAATRIALDAGARRIALVGADLAFARTGRGYAPDSQWDGINLTNGHFREDDLRVHRGICAAVGIPPSLSRTTPTETVPAWDGGEPLQALSQWSEQARWLADLARSRPEIDWIAANEGGRSVDGWRQTTLQSVIDMPPSHRGNRIRLSPPMPADFDRLIHELLASCDRLERIAGEVLNPTDRGLMGIEDFHLGAQLVEVWAQRDYIDAEGLPPAQQLERYENARIAAARAMRSLLGGQS